MLDQIRTSNGFVALITVLIMGAVGVAVGISAILLGLGYSKSSFAIEQSGQSRALANACAEEALQIIDGSTPYTGTGNLSLGGGTCTYTVTSQGGQNRTVTTTGTYGTVIRKVSIVITKINPNIEISTWQEEP